MWITQPMYKPGGADGRAQYKPEGSNPLATKKTKGTGPNTCL